MEARPNRSSPARALTRVVAVAAIGFGLIAALVAATDAQRTCFGFDEICDGPHWADAAIAFVIACLLVTTGVVILVQLRRRGATGPPHPPPGR